MSHIAPALRALERYITVGDHLPLVIGLVSVVGIFVFVTVVISGEELRELLRDDHMGGEE